MTSTLHYFRQKLLIISSGILLFSCMDNIQAEWTEFIVDSQVSYTFQDNINHSMFSNEAANEHSWNALLTAGIVYQLTNYTRMIAKLYVDGSAHLNFNKLDQINLGGSVAVRHKFGMGAFQPWIGGSVSTGYDFSKSNIRSGQLTTVGVDVGKRLYDRLNISFHYQFDHRNSETPTALADSKLIAAGIQPDKSSSVFDTQGHTIGVQFNALLTQRWMLVLAYNFRDGDIVSSSRPARIPELDGIIDAIAFDDALPGWAYRAKAQTHQYSIDANYAFLAGHAALNIGYQYVESHASPFTYRNNFVRVNLLYSF